MGAEPADRAIIPNYATLAATNLGKAVNFAQTLRVETGSAHALVRVPEASCASISLSCVISAARSTSLVSYRCPMIGWPLPSARRGSASRYRKSYHARMLGHGRDRR